MRDSLDTTIADRVRRFFDEQREWFLTLLQQTTRLREALQSSNSDSDFGKFEAPDTGRIERIEQELLSLAEEWERRGDIPEAERQEIRSRAIANQELLTQVRNAYDEVIDLVEKRSNLVSESLRSLRKGRNTLAGYRIDRPRDPWFIDKKI